MTDRDEKTQPPVILTRDAVVGAGACADGMMAWDEYLDGGDAHATGGWTRDVQILALHTPLRRYLGWAWDRGVLPMWSMAGADLTGANLSEADLIEADLSGANLTEADLSGADLPDGWRDVADCTGARR
mgnify:CR=1 FL=1